MEIDGHRVRKVPLVLTVNTLVVEPVTDDAPDKASLPPRAVPLPAAPVVKRPEWSLKSSTFASFEGDTEEVLRASFETDFALTK